MPPDPQAPPRAPVIALAGIVIALLVGFTAGTSAGDGARRGGSGGPRPTDPSAGPAASGPASAPASAAPSLAPVPPPSRRFGVVAHLLWGDDAAALRTLDEVAAAGLGVIRFDVSWRQVEPERGRTEDVDRLDRVMQAIAARGMRPIVTVIDTPDWANGGRGRWTPPDDPATYAAFVAGLAARYATVADVAWEVWNEPNDPRFWQPAPDPAGYTRLLVATAAAIRAAAPGATVLGGSILYGDRDFLQRMYDAGAKGSFDGLAVHPYGQNRAPADTGDPYHSFAGGLGRIRAVMAANGDATPIWITEMGWTAADGVDEATRARYFADAVRLVAGWADVEVFAAYVYGPAVDRGYDLASSGPGSQAFAGYRDAVRSVSATP